ncbi:MAG: helix-hairpin-helix domain-containing protein [Cyanobacteria bacterium P01_F01_bin.150]
MHKTRPRAIALALAGIMLPGLHKFYLKQRGWGIAYLMLYPTHIPQLASVLEGIWYVWLGQDKFEQRFNPAIARLLATPYATLNTPDDIQLAAQLELTINVNRATLKDWQRLPQLSSAQSTLLVQLTQAGLQFNSVDDVAAALGLDVSVVQPLAPVLRFYYYDAPNETAVDMDGVGEASADGADGGLLINPNQASLSALMMVPDISEATAQHIIQQRKIEPYKDLVDFKERLALSAEAITSLMYYIRF